MRVRGQLSLVTFLCRYPSMEIRIFKVGDMVDAVDTGKERSFGRFFLFG